MGALLGLGYLVYLIFVVFLTVAIVKQTKKIRYGVFAFIIAGGLPIYDVIITNALGAYYCYSDPKPKSFVKKTVEYPESIYWEDNIYPGFSEEDIELMVKQYLNGIYLKKLALNGDDEKIYVCTADLDFLKRLDQDEIYKKLSFDDRFKLYVKTICQSYEKSTMPKMNYMVISNEVNLSNFASKYLYSDEIKVIENKTGELIGYNSRLMHFFHNLFPDWNLGNRYYFPEPICGDQNNYRVPAFLFSYLTINEDGQHALTKRAKWGLSYHVIDKNEFLYEKQNKKGK